VVQSRSGWTAPSRTRPVRRRGRFSVWLARARGLPLELPGREASDVDVEVVQNALDAIVFELDLELYLILRHGQHAHRTWGADAWTSPRPIRLASGKLSITDRVSGFLAEKELVWHLAVPQKARRDQNGGVEPDARGLNARCVNQGSPMEGELSLPHQVHDEHGGRGEPQGGDPEVPPGFGSAVGGSEKPLEMPGAGCPARGRFRPRSGEVAWPVPEPGLECPLRRAPPAAPAACRPRQLPRRDGGNPSS
jgi:hypothetical protein